MEGMSSSFSPSDGINHLPRRLAISSSFCVVFYNLLNRMVQDGIPAVPHAWDYTAINYCTTSIRRTACFSSIQI